MSPTSHQGAPPRECMIAEALGITSTFRPPVGAVLWFLFLCVGTKSPYPPRERVEMKRRKLQDGWEEIFLEPWALHEDIERVRALVELPPPRQAASGN